MSALLVEPGSHRRPYDAATVDRAFVDIWTYRLSALFVLAPIAAFCLFMTRTADVTVALCGELSVLVGYLLLRSATRERTAVPAVAFRLRRTERGRQLLVEGNALVDLRRRIDEDRVSKIPLLSDEQCLAHWRHLLACEAELYANQQQLLSAFP